jgi:hypothetical protein
LIAFNVITSRATRQRLDLIRPWTDLIRRPHAFRVFSDEDVGRAGYLSAIDKTLAAIRLAPKDAAWVYICDDDAWLVPHRLEAALAEYDHTKPAAVGSSRGWIMSENYSASRKFRGIHGGPGFALSRPLAASIRALIMQDKIIRHNRNSDATVAITLDRLGVVPHDDYRWHPAHPPKSEMGEFAACHEIREAWIAESLRETLTAVV